jgi:beta-lactamase class A
MNLRAACRLAVACAALLFALGVRAETRQVPDLREVADPALQSALEGAVRDVGLEDHARGGRLALALVDLTRADAPRLAMLNGDKLMYAASLPKIAILFGALVEAESGRLPIDERTVGAMTNMIRYSSNEDASRVLNWVGGARLIEILQSDRYRFYDPQGAGGLWVGKAYGKDAAYRRDPLGNLSHGATAFQVARLYYLLASDALLSPGSNALMKEILSRPGIHHKFVKALAGVPGAQIFRKSGTWKDCHADSALVEYAGHRYIMVGIAQNPQGGEWLERLGIRMHGLVVTPLRSAAAGG